MRNRGGYHKNNYHRGGGRGGYNSRGGKYNNYKRRRSSFERDDYQEEHEPVFGESSGAALGNFKIVLGGGESRVIAGENEDVPSIQSRLGTTKLRTRIHSSEEEDQQESKVMTSRIVRPPAEKKERSPSPSRSVAKSNRVVTTSKSGEKSAKEQNVNGSSKIGASHSRSARIKASSRSPGRQKTRSKDDTNKKQRSPTPKRRRSKSGSPKISKKSSSSPKRSSRRSPSKEKISKKSNTRKVSSDRREIKPAEPMPVSNIIEPDQNFKRPEVLSNPQLTQLDIDELVELNFDFFKKQLKKIVNHRDRLGRTPLMIILEYTAIKSNIKSFEESHFKHVTRATRELISSGADIRMKDIFGDTIMQYLARWRYGKENFKNEQHLPRRTREILKELPLKETGRGAISIADLKDAEGKTFYHNLFWSNFRDQSQVEIDRLAAAFEIIVGSLKMNDADWEIEDGEGNTLADTLLESELFSKAAYRAIKEKSGRVTLCSLKTFLKLLSGKNQSPRRKDEERARKQSPSPVRRKRSSEGEYQRLKSQERPSSRKQQSQVDYYSDSEHADEMDIHANADDFIDDVIQLIPQKKNRTTSRRSETPKRKRSRSSSKSKRAREDQSRRTRRESDTSRNTRKTRRSPSPIPEEPVRRRHDSRSSKKNGDAHSSPSRDHLRRRKSTEMMQRNDSRGGRSPDRRRQSRHVSKSPERKRPMHNDDRRHKDRASPMRLLDSSHSPERRRSPERRSRRESKDQLLRLANY
ncbi:unnamed protein product [Oikopleura dioica]|uniref:Uncharacterized protein n=1 Tax=Oikopleura dioica TaxID=34765 RepID=E4X345_OIKDI|nr:unnamed protein product [Oikopleura dioica]